MKVSVNPKNPAYFPIVGNSIVREFFRIFNDRMNKIHPIFINDDDFDYTTRTGVVRVVFNEDATRSDFIEWLAGAGCLNEYAPLNISCNKTVWSYSVDSSEQANGLVTRLFYLEPVYGESEESMMLILEKHGYGAIVCGDTQKVRPANISAVVQRLKRVPDRIKIKDTSYRLIEVTGISDFIRFPDDIRESLYDCLIDQMTEDR